MTADMKVYRIKVTYPDGYGPGDWIKPPGYVFALRIPDEREFLSRDEALVRVADLEALGCMCELEESDPITWPAIAEPAHIRARRTRA